MPLENIGVWSAPPDWADGLLEALEWQTSVLKSTLAYEQRFGTRLSPRQNFTVNFTAHDEQRMMLDL